MHGHTGLCCSDPIWIPMPLRILLNLGALSAFAPLAIDFYPPSFPTLARVFATDVEHVQLSLAAYFVGLAIGQLPWHTVRRLIALVGVNRCWSGFCCSAWRPWPAPWHQAWSG